jgi:phosphomannomutase
MNLNPDIFKAYDVRGVYPGEVNEDAARAIGAAFVVYLQAKRIAVSRDMRVSSPTMAAAFIDGATSQGADVVDYGMQATDMLYFAVAKDGLGAVQGGGPTGYNRFKWLTGHHSLRPVVTQTEGLFLFAGSSSWFSHPGFLFCMPCSN